MRVEIPVKFWIRRKISQDAMTPTRPIMAEVRVPAAPAAFLGSPLLRT